MKMAAHGYLDNVSMIITNFNRFPLHLKSGMLAKKDVPKK